MTSGMGLSTDVDGVTGGLAESASLPACMALCISRGGISPPKERLELLVLFWLVARRR